MHQLARRLGQWIIYCSVGILAILVMVSAVSLPFSIRWFNAQDLDSAIRHPPVLKPIIPWNTYHAALEKSGRAIISNRESAKHDIATVENDTRAASTPSGVTNFAYQVSSWLGHDDLGRSLLYRLLPAFLISFGIGGAAAIMATVIGTSWGAVAALIGGRVDQVMMRIVDVLYGLPYILMVILLKTALTRPLAGLLGGASRLADIIILFVAIGGVSWLTMARVVRGQVLSLKTRAFVEAARVAGGGTLYIIRRHLVPNLTGLIAVYATLVVPQAILQESFLSFLGIGVAQPTPTLGGLAADGVQAVNSFVGYWWLIVFPCGVLSVTILALQFLGDALRQSYERRSRGGSMLV
ncbi:MAG: ABC transporter permease [Planctomycetes bacterium]|nr:ABC transporter permease [Planctomycetota bacterium]MBI3834918.1 ABC transporter permease [Planctomycetota bacterium]